MRVIHEVLVWNDLKNLFENVLYHKNEANSSPSSQQARTIETEHPVENSSKKVEYRMIGSYVVSWQGLALSDNTV